MTRGKLVQDKAEKALLSLRGVLDYSEFKDVDMVIEVCCYECFRFTRLLSLIEMLAKR